MCIAFGTSDSWIVEIDFTQARRLTDLVFPEGEHPFRFMEGFVIKAHWQKRRYLIDIPTFIFYYTTIGIDCSQLHIMSNRDHISTDIGVYTIRHQRIDIMIGKTQ